MRRQAIGIAIFVFTCSAIAELLCVHLVTGSIVVWLHHPRRLAVLVTMLIVNLLNAVVAGYLAYGMRDALLRWRSSEHERRFANDYINHHIRNALTSLQYAAYLTQDAQVMGICDESIARIVGALAAADRGIPATDQLRKFGQPTPIKSSRAKRQI